MYRSFDVQPQSRRKPECIRAAVFISWAAVVAFGCGDGAAPSAEGAPSGLAVLSSDYKVTSVALYHPGTGRLADDCLRSGATSPVLKQSLSGDATLPSGTQNGELVVIDRENAVLTFVTPATCVARAQLSVSTGGFKSNPHDVVAVGREKAYVTRFETNLAPTADPADFDEGDDLLVINPSTTTILGRVPLAMHATTAAGAVIQARPDRGVFAEGLVYVTLNNLAADFSVSGPGRIVIIDPATDAVKDVIDLPEQAGCSGITYVPAKKRLFVTCGGQSSDGPAQAARSALVQIDIAGPAPVVGPVVPATALGNQPFSYASPAVLGDAVFVATVGALDFATGQMTAADAFYRVDVADGTATKVMDGGAYNLGRSGTDPATNKVFLPDGDAVIPRVRVFDIANDGVSAAGAFEPNPTGHLPPREIAPY